MSRLNTIQDMRDMYLFCVPILCGVSALCTHWGCLSMPHIHPQQQVVVI